jgi:hypothetical protein
MRSTKIFLPLSLLVIASCGSDPAAPAKPPVASNTTATPTGTNDIAPAPKPYVAPAPRFENPGGMWMPHQIKDHAAKLKELGLAIDPASLADPTSGTLSAIIYLGGCSASFISPDGLIATNHHCATGALQHNSNPSANLLKDGFLAKSRAEEKNNGPSARVFVTRQVSDITAKMRDGLDKIGDDRARYKEIEKRQKEAVAACEKDRPGTRCSATSFYERAQWFLIEQQEIRDVRLVWAPPAGVGNYGGEIDNWRWPRHTGDVSLFRAYVGKDGKPADFSPDNVPYKPAHHLKIATDPLREGDLVFVAGYPARTNTLKTKAEVDEAISWAYPRRQKLFEENLARMEEATKDDKEAQIRSTSFVRGWGNALTNTKGQLDGLVKGGLAQDKEKNEKALREFVAADPKRKADWGKALDDIASEIQKNAAFREKDAQLSEMVTPRLMAAALTIVRMAEERPKPDAQRDPDFQERNWPRIEQSIKGLTTSYHPKVDQAVFGLALERTSKSTEADRSPAFAIVMGAGGGNTKDVSGEAIKKVVSNLYTTTTLGDEAARTDLLKKGTTATLTASKDPLIQLALKLRPMQKTAEERDERLAGKWAMLKPKYIEALKAFRKEPFAPDANSTLRITYGTVRGYKPTPDAQPYRPFTMLSEVVGKHKGKEPFDTPQPVIDAFKAKKVGPTSGPYVDSTLGEVPVDFLADLHITGGNSGSATLNAKGELVGLVFDGNYEAMASDWVFIPSITRSIHVDVRYILWLLDGPFQGDHILKEMGVTPKL